MSFIHASLLLLVVDVRGVEIVFATVASGFLCEKEKKERDKKRARAGALELLVG